MINLKLVGERLKKHRKLLYLSQQQVAEMTNVTNQAVSKWENGAALPDIEMLLKLGELYDTSMEYLLEGDPKIKNPNPARLSGLLSEVDGLGELSGPFSVLSRYLNREELFEAVRLFDQEGAELHLVLEAVNSRAESTSKVQKKIPVNGLSLRTMEELGPALYDVIITFQKKANHDIGKVVKLLRCPVCASELHIDRKFTTLHCANKHKHHILESVVYFGTREDPGNSWSNRYNTFEQYVHANNNGDNRLSRSPGAVIGFPKMLAKLREHRFERIMEIGTGEGTWIEYLVRNVDWPCCIFLTDLSHRILKYNKRYIMKRYYNPYVSLVYLACDAGNLPFRDDTIDCVTSWAGYENMGENYDRGLSESYRVLKKGGAVVYHATTCDDEQSDLVRRWIELLKGIGAYERAKTMICDRSMWEEKLRRIGFSQFGYGKTRDEISAPEGEEFPYEDEIMQWMGTAVIAAVK